MKRAMIYLISISALLTALLSGCGENIGKNPTATPPATSPDVTMQPEIVEPDVSDGVVKDTDGMITEGDNGGSKNVMDVPEQSKTGTGAAEKAGGGTDIAKSAGVK